MITVITCRGIGEGYGDNMLANVTRHLDPKRFTVRELPWSAEYGVVPAPLGFSFDTSLTTGRTMLHDAIRRDPNPVVLLGYSGGAALAGNIAAEIGRGEYPDMDIRGVGLISDPLRERTRGSAFGWGIAGQRRIPPANWPVWYCADPSDVITCCPGTSPLRTLADQSAAMSLADASAWGWDLLRRVREQRFQATIRDWRNVREVWRSYAAAIDGAKGYLTGSHTSYNQRLYPGADRTYCEWLADRINEIEERP